MMYSTRFSTMTVNVQASRPMNDADGNAQLDKNSNKMYESYTKVYDVEDLNIGNADLYLVALTIKTDIERKQENPNAKNDAFVESYSKTGLNKYVCQVLELFDSSSTEDFAPEMFSNYKRWGRGKMGKKDNKRAFISDTFDENCGYDPYVLSASQSKTSLSQAGFSLLAKAFRFYLEETLRHFFQKPDPNSWYPYTDTRGKKFFPDSVYLGTRTSSTFNSAIQILLGIFDSVYKWSPHLEEFVKATDRAIDLGRADRNAKSTARLATTAGIRTYGVSDSKFRSKPDVRSAKPFIKTDKKYDKRPAKVVEPKIEKAPRVIKITDVDDEGWITPGVKIVKNTDV
jgi:hypothetical protein